MAPLWIALAALLAAEPADVDRGKPPTAATQTVSTFRYTPKQWHQAVHAALRSEAISRGTQRDMALIELTSLYRQIEHTSALAESQRRPLRALVRNRLARRAAELRNQLANSSDKSTSGARPASEQAKLPGKERTILAQQAPRLGAPAAAPNNSPARELIDLIQNTIAPQSWEINGGPGTIRYFELGHLLVVRQTAEVHGALGDVLGQLRGN